MCRKLNVGVFKRNRLDQFRNVVEYVAACTVALQSSRQMNGDCTGCRRLDRSLSLIHI